MTEREDTIERIERVLKLTHKESITVTIPRLTAERAVSILKEQEARVVTTADFGNNPNLDDSNHLNVWEEYRDGTRCGWNTININDVSSFTDIRRYWTSRPTEEQRKAVKWE